MAQLPLEMADTVAAFIEAGGVLRKEGTSFFGSFSARPSGSTLILGCGPLPVFLEMQILKGFKSCVLKVRILRELEADFLDVRIPKSLDGKTARAKTGGAEAPHLQRREKE